MEAGGRGSGLGDHSATLGRGTPGVLHGSYSMLLQDADGQVQETHSISAGLDYPGVGPEHSLLKAIGRVQYVSATDAEALEALRECCAAEGILPALESSHALAGARRWAREHPGKRILIGLSGRGDKDMPTLSQVFPGAASRQESPLRTRHAADSCPTSASPPPSATPRGPTAWPCVPYITAGYPEKAKFIPTLRAIAEVGDVIEVGVPFSDPMADGVTIQRASHAAIASGVSLRWILAELKKAGELPAPVVLMSYLNPLLAFGFDKLAAAAVESHVGGFIVPDLPLEESAELHAQLDARGLALIHLVTPATPEPRMQGALRRQPRLRLRRHGQGHHRRRPRPAGGGHRLPRPRARPVDAAGLRRLRRAHARSRCAP